MAIDDEEILSVLGGVRADEPGPPAGTTPAPADQWSGPHQVAHARESPSGGTIAMAVSLAFGPFMLVFLSIWLGSPGPRDARMALATTASLAVAMGLIGSGFYLLSRLDRATSAFRGESPGGARWDWHGIGRVIDYPAFSAFAAIVALIWVGVSWAWNAARNSGGRDGEDGPGKPRPARDRWDGEE